MSSNGELGLAGQKSRSLGLPGAPLHKAAQLFLTSIFSCVLKYNCLKIRLQGLFMAWSFNAYLD